MRNRPEGLEGEKRRPPRPPTYTSLPPAPPRSQPRPSSAAAGCFCRSQWPSLQQAPPPQLQTAPAAVRAKLWQNPAATATTRWPATFPPVKSLCGGGVPSSHPSFGGCRFLFFLSFTPASHMSERIMVSCQTLPRQSHSRCLFGLWHRRHHFASWRSALPIWAQPSFSPAKGGHALPFLPGRLPLDPRGRE